MQGRVPCTLMLKPMLERSPSAENPTFTRGFPLLSVPAGSMVSVPSPRTSPHPPHRKPPADRLMS